MYRVGFAKNILATSAAVMLARLSRCPEDAYFEEVTLGKDYVLIVFTGGEDFSSSLYGGQALAPTKRDEEEIRVFNAYKNTPVKFIGICRGHQLLNVLYGGKLIEDIRPPHPSMHTLDNGWFVNSIHHQGVRLLGDGVENLGIFRDEIEMTRNEKFLSFQFHPEFQLPTPEEEFEELMKEFLGW